MNMYSIAVFNPTEKGVMTPAEMLDDLTIVAQLVKDHAYEIGISCGFFRPAHYPVFVLANGLRKLVRRMKRTISFQAALDYPVVKVDKDAFSYPVPVLPTELFGFLEFGVRTPDDLLADAKTMLKLVNQRSFEIGVRSGFLTHSHVPAYELSEGLYALIVKMERSIKRTPAVVKTCPYGDECLLNENGPCGSVHPWYLS